MSENSKISYKLVLREIDFSYQVVTLSKMVLEA